MSLAQIVYPPPTEQGWQEWLHAHIRHHEALAGALQAKFDVILDSANHLYPLDMESKDQLEVWNKAHLDLHNSMNSLLGIPGQDISAPDFKDKRKSDGWFFLHLQLHRSTADLCGQPV